MDHKIWSHLPNELFFKIISALDDIDIRLSFRVPPRRLTINKNFEFRNENVYDMSRRILFQNKNGIFLIRKNINLSTIRNGSLYVFNMEWEPYELTIYVDQYSFNPIECSEHVVISNKKVKFPLQYGPRNMGKLAV